VSLLVDRRRFSIPGSFESIRNVRAHFQGWGVIAFHCGRLQERRAKRRGGARIIILPPTVNFAGDAQAMRIRVVRWYLKESRQEAPKGMIEPKRKTEKGKRGGHKKERMIRILDMLASLFRKVKNVRDLSSRG